MIDKSKFSITKLSNFSGGTFMAQIVCNYMAIFIIPLLVGFIVRFLLRKRKKAWIVTVTGAVLSLIGFIVALNPPVSGNEAYGLLTIATACATAASAITGLVYRLLRKNKTER